MYRDPLQALLLPLSYPYVQGPTTSTSAASVLPLCTGTHYKHFCCLCPTLMYRDPLQALLLPLSYPSVQGPTTSTSAASVLPLCTGTHYKHFCPCPTLMYRDPLQALLLPLSYPYVQGPTTSTSAPVLPLCTGTHYKHFCCLCPTPTLPLEGYRKALQHCTVILRMWAPIAHTSVVIGKQWTVLAHLVFASLDQVAELPRPCHIAALTNVDEIGRSVNSNCLQSCV